MGKLKERHLISKSHVLNEMRSQTFTLQELRILSIYLAKIDPRDPTTRIVSFPLSEFRKIMELDRVYARQLHKVTAELLAKVVTMRDPKTGEYDQFQLFQRCKLVIIEGYWHITLNAHDEALPMMFDFRDGYYFKYKLWNALRLKSSNQVRMYEILKQYEKAGFRILPINELRELLGIGEDEYTRYNNFKQWVLNPCQKALAEHTDIKYTYEPHGRRGKAGAILALKFTIIKNEDFNDQLMLEEWLPDDEQLNWSGAGAKDIQELADVLQEGEE